MPKTKCETCISKSVKDLLAERFPGLRAKIDKIPECAQPGDINLCVAPADGRKRSKREPSAYNRFISTCMKDQNIHGRAEAPEAMRSCAAAWQKSKGTTSTTSPTR